MCACMCISSCMRVHQQLHVCMRVHQQLHVITPVACAVLRPPFSTGLWCQRLWGNVSAKIRSALTARFTDLCVDGRLCSLSSCPTPPMAALTGCSGFSAAGVTDGEVTKQRSKQLADRFIGFDRTSGSMKLSCMRTSTEELPCPTGSRKLNDKHTSLLVLCPTLVSKVST